MAKPNIDAEIRARITAFLDLMAGLVKKAALESVQEVLGGRSERRRRGPGRPRKSARRRPGRPRRVARRGKRTSAQVEALAGRVLKHVKATPGHRLEQIGKRMRIATKELKLPITKLLGAKKLKTKGRKRGTRYFAR